MVESRTAVDWADAALDAFASAGVHAASIPAIARALGVTKGSFYWHFRGLAELIDASLRRWQERDRAFLTELRTIDDPHQRLVAVFRESLDASQAQALFIALSASSMPQVVSAVRRVSERRIAFLRQTYEELGLRPRDANERALLVYASYVGLLHLRAEAPAALRTRKQIDAFVAHAVQTLVPRA